QSTHSSDETSNDRGAKGVQEDGRKLNRTTVQPPLRVPARAVPQRIVPSAYDLDDTVERKAALETARRACSLSPRPHRPESRMREIRPSGSEGGVAPTRHPYPYRRQRQMRPCQSAPSQINRNHVSSSIGLPGSR